MLLIEEKNSFDNFLETITREINGKNDLFIAVDTEFMRENLEKPLLCLVQIATSDEVFIIDPMAVEISQLNRIFSHPQIKKVFHSAFQDIEILSLYGINTINFYDTQLYETVLSTNDSISYQSIVSRYLDKQLRKNHSMSDWKKRPLSKKQLLYSANDVFYLREVYKKQLQKLIELHRENWLDEELQQIKSKQDDFAKTLSENNLNVYNQLKKWQKEKAAEKGISPELMVKNDILKAVCKKGVNFIHHIKNSRNMKNENHKEFLLFAEKIAEKLEISEKPDRQNAIIGLLKTLLGICSLKHSVATSMIATTNDLEGLLNGDRNIKFLSGWRNEIFGKEAVMLLNGEISLKIDKSKVVIAK
ncbi:MAG: hypothetical protein LBQ08_02910 [Holosporaceae bacterium]|jgi:ribonuclease D|nr:hypothetical protein [Holosporaceae bacterium]